MQIFYLKPRKVLFLSLSMVPKRWGHRNIMHKFVYMPWTMKIILEHIFGIFLINDLDELKYMLQTWEVF